MHYASEVLAIVSIVTPIYSVVYISTSIINSFEIQRRECMYLSLCIRDLTLSETEFCTT